jgi:hypothetical protein
MNALMIWNAQTQVVVVKYPRTVPMNPPDPFGGWSAVDETVRLMMRPEVPGVTA